MTAELTGLLIVCPLAFLAGFVDSIAGGGGLISLPAYYLAGLPPALAAGSNKTAAVFGTAVATGRYALSGRVPWKQALAALAGSLPGSYLGALLLTRLPPHAARVAVLAALPAVGLFLLLKRDAMEPRKRFSDPLSLPACAGIGLLVGAYDGLVGPGAGTFYQIAFVALIGLEALSASGAARLVNLGSGVGALVRFIGQGQVLYSLALPAAAFGMAGNWLGSSLALRRGPALVRLLMLAVLALLLVTLAREVLA